MTTGGPVSTASDAFNTDANAPTVTTFSYQGGALTYTLVTFTSLSTQKDIKTITTRVTKTQDTDSAVQTFVGPIVVGPHGIFWGPPGTAPDCKEVVEEGVTVTAETEEKMRANHHLKPARLERRPSGLPSSVFSVVGSSNVLKKLSLRSIR